MVRLGSHVGLTLLPPLLLACVGRGRVQILLSSLRLAAEAGFLDVALLVLFYFWQPQTKLLLDVLPLCQGA